MFCSLLYFRLIILHRLIDERWLFIVVSFRFSTDRNTDCRRSTAFPPPLQGINCQPSRDLPRAMFVPSRASTFPHFWAVSPLGWQYVVIPPSISSYREWTFRSFSLIYRSRPTVLSSSTVVLSTLHAILRQYHAGLRRMELPLSLSRYVISISLCFFYCFAH